jgi:hypothetical protein
VHLTGPLRVPDVGSIALRGTALPLDVMRDAARRVGGFIANAKLDALAGHSVQEIETWDDPDEAAAQQIAAQLANNDSIVELGDDAQLLAGATLALLANPDPYDDVTARLNEALDSSYGHDPIWGPAQPDPIINLVRMAPPRKKKKR